MAVIKISQTGIRVLFLLDGADRALFPARIQHDEYNRFGEEEKIQSRPEEVKSSTVYEVDDDSNKIMNNYYCR